MVICLGPAPDRWLAPPIRGFFLPSSTCLNILFENRFRFLSSRASNKCSLIQL